MRCPARRCSRVRLTDQEKLEAYERLSRGEVLVERLEARAAGDTIRIPKGLVHHWVGTVSIPGVSVDSTIAMVRDYNRYAQIYDPNVRKASIVSQEGDRFRVYAQL